MKLWRWLRCLAIAVVNRLSRWVAPRAKDPRWEDPGSTVVDMRPWVGWVECHVCKSKRVWDDGAGQYSACRYCKPTCAQDMS